MQQMNKSVQRRALLALILCVFFGISGGLLAQDHHEGSGEPRPESTRVSSIPLNPASSNEIGAVYEAYLSPQQEGGEEEDTPAFIPEQFRSTAPSTPREQRAGRGHAVIEFTRDLSRAYVHLAVTNIPAEDIVMLHLHCGRPGQLGPIIVDFGLAGDVPTYLADGTMSIEISNHDIEAVTEGSSGLVDAFTRGCPIVAALPNDKVKTIGGLELIARAGEIYFNLHTKGQVYFGDIRGQFVLVTP
jgi:hypothetical protein